MSNAAKLKKRALEFEQKKQFDKALEAYSQILEGLDEHVDEADVALFNRVGDLLLRRGDVAEAVDHYERAVDLYTDGGFFNNAIALCNKILRNAPGRNSVYYKLGRISAKKGFINDAKQNFLEYADRMQRAGQLEEAFRALKEFADLCPDQDDIRLMLADQLVRKDRKREAIEQLQLLYEKFSAEGRTREARATVDRMKALDPEFEPTTGPGRPTPKANDLVFLDVDFDQPGPGARAAAPAARAPTVAPPPKTAEKAAPPVVEPPLDAEPDVVAEVEPQSEAEAEPEAEIEEQIGGDLPFVDVQQEFAPPRAADPVEGLTGSDAFAEPPSVPAAADLESHVDLGLITGFEQTAVGDDVGTEPLAQGGLGDLDDLIPDLGMENGTGAVTGAEHDAEAMADLDALMELPPALRGEGDETPAGELRFIYPDDEPAAAAGDVGTTDLELGSMLSDDLAIPDDDEIAAAEPSAVTGEEPAPAAFDLGGLDADVPDVDLPLIHEPPAFDRGHASHAAQPEVERLRNAAQLDPNDFDLRRQLAEALLEDGQREAGLAELERAMLGFELAGEMRSASAMAEELIRVEPGSVRFHQKRVEYAVRANDKSRLVDAYLSLAECLLGAGQLDKSRAVYARVLELAPDEPRAREALSALGGDELQSPASLTPTGLTPAASPAIGAPRGAERREHPAPRSDDSFVNLADWLREDEAAKSTRMVVDVDEPKVNEQVDFAEMLSMFKQGVAANVDETDHESHYDLGVAYKEMGLLDDAIAEFQKALRGSEHRVRTYEALGQCFVEKRQYQIALTILSRALTDPGVTDDVLVGVLYLLGYASEGLGRWADALRFYERVFAVDIQFRDIGDRLAAVERRAR